MTYEEFMNSEFKTGSNGEHYILKDELPHVNRRVRRWIEKELKKGREPSFMEIYDKIIGNF